MNIQSIIILLIILLLFVIAVKHMLGNGIKCSGNCANCRGGNKSCCH